jgi:3,4-dihydroxy 2-butanone 4-phosphate synthase
MSNSTQIAKRIAAACEAMRAGLPVVLMDDETRENEADLIAAAETLSHDVMARLIRDCSGIVCLCLDDRLVRQLDLPPMVAKNETRYGTAFTVSIEARLGVTTGVSAADRLTTVRAAIADNARPEDLARPGHVFPLRAQPGGVLTRRGHTEGAVDLARLAGLKPAAVLCELMDRQGEMLRGKHPEIYEPGVSATFWLYRALPDPTPPSRRLKPRFAKQLSLEAKRARVDWALVLGVLRARGERGAVPATRVELRRLSTRLARLGARRSPWSAALALEGRTAFADRAVALQHYNRAVGLQSLVKGLEWAKPKLAKAVLNDSRISIYPGGRFDISSGKTDIRILVLIRYLAESHGEVTVSSLTTGHRLFSRPGVVSAHIYGLAVDIASLGGLSIMGNSGPGGLTEQGVRNILLLPAELQPRQVISLLGMGGPSFPMGNHDDHIHVGY